MITPAITQAAKEMLIDYLGGKTGLSKTALIGEMPFEIVAISRQARYMGTVLYTNLRCNSLEMACAGEPGWLTRADVAALFAYPFIQLDLSSVLSHVERSNSKSRNLAARLGFREVGVLFDEYGHGRDGIIYQMQRSKCRWLGSK